MRHNLKTIFCSLVLSCFMIPSVAQAQFSIELDLPDFGVTDVFGQLTTLDLNVDVAGPLVAGAVYSDPVLNGVVYDVFGLLDEDSVPSGFPAFNLSRTIGGAEFFSQGSSLNFEVSSTADVSDGLQISELVADANGLIFEFDGREVGTGRFHPPLIQLFADGTLTRFNFGDRSAGTVVDVPSDGHWLGSAFASAFVNLLIFKQLLWIPACR